MTIEASQVERYLLQARYIIPFGDPAVENLTLQTTVDQLQLADVTTHTQSIGPSITTRSVTGSTSCSRTPPKPPTTPSRDRTPSGCWCPGIDLASVPKGYLGEPIFQHPFFAELRGSNAAIGSDSNFLQLHMQAEHVFQIADKWHLLLRDEVGGHPVSIISTSSPPSCVSSPAAITVCAALPTMSCRLSTQCARRSPPGTRPPRAGQRFPFIKTAARTSSRALFEVIRDLPP